jgi:hypothetical protein
MATKQIVKSSKKKSAPAIPDARKLPLINADVPSAYANNVEIMTAGSVDVRIAFNEILVDRGGMTLARKANIVLSTPIFLEALQIFNRVARDIIARSAPQASAPTGITVGNGKESV